MQYVNLGRSGLKVSRICLGCMSYGSRAWRQWILEEEESRPFIRQALELGINFFDTADFYSLGASEEIVGRALADFARREEIVVATKVYHKLSDKPNDRGLSRKHLMASIDASLTRLKMDYVDLYQIHRWDYETPIEETLEALNDVVRSGKALYIGASSTWAWQLAWALQISDRNGWTKFVSMQNHYNLIYREEEREMLPLCRETGIGILPWSPLARGFLAGTRSLEDKGDTLRARTDSLAHEYYYQPGDFSIVDRVKETARKYGRPAAQVSLAWLLSRPGITAPVVGATRKNHLEDAVSALDLKLTNEDIAALEAPYQPHPILGHS